MTWQVTMAGNDCGWNNPFSYPGLSIRLGTPYRFSVTSTASPVLYLRIDCSPCRATPFPACRPSWVTIDVSAPAFNPSHLLTPGAYRFAPCSTASAANLSASTGHPLGTLSDGITGREAASPIIS